MINKPDFSHGWLDNYISLVELNDLRSAFETYSESAHGFFAGISDKDSGFAYAPGKWSIRELLGHITDCERIFVYRALVIARGEKYPLPGFDEDLLVANSGANSRSFPDLMQEYLAVRNASKYFFGSLSPDAAFLRGVANGRETSPAGIGFAMLGHELHHIRVIQERYLPLLKG